MKWLEQAKANWSIEVNLSRVCRGIGFGSLTFLVIVLAACGGGSGNGSPPPPPSAPTITNFTANPNNIMSGQSASLAWQVIGATSIQISNITATLSAPSSSIVVLPAETTTYTLTATNAVGSMQKSAMVTVTMAPTVATVQINPAASTQAIPPNFLDIGQEMADTLTMVGTSSSNMNPIYEQLLKNLILYANAPMLIREYADGANSDVYGQNYLAALSQLNKDLGVQFFVGVDFVDDVVSTATGEAADLAAGLPAGALQAIELGNESDLYGNSGERPAGWDYTGFLSDYQQFAPALTSASGGVKLSAPVWAGLSTKFMNNLDSFISAEASTVAIVTVHHYSGTACSGAAEPGDYLLTEPAVDGDAQPLTGPVGMSSYLSAAQQAGIPFRIGELNSINCGGQAGVSNSFSSALWGMDISFSYANVGVTGVNFFSPGDVTTTHPYSPFDFTFTSNADGTRTYAVRDINPLYYGLLLFAETVQNKAQLLPITLTTGANIKVWATIDADGTIRLLVLNKDETASGLISIALNGYGQALVTRLIAPSYSSTTGVTIGGQTFDGSSDGTLQGTAYMEIVQPSSGSYAVAVPAVSAALVTIQQ
jgi:hypothetical protein